MIEGETTKSSILAAQLSSAQNPHWPFVCLCCRFYLGYIKEARVTRYELFLVHRSCSTSANAMSPVHVLKLCSIGPQFHRATFEVSNDQVISLSAARGSRNPPAFGLCPGPRCLRPGAARTLRGGSIACVVVQKGLNTGSSSFFPTTGTLCMC